MNDLDRTDCVYSDDGRAGYFADLENASYEEQLAFAATVENFWFKLHERHGSRGWNLNDSRGWNLIGIE